MLGSDKHHTVCKGKLARLRLCTELLRKERNIKLATLYMDNQVNIKSTNIFNQYLVII
jgi:hypothetical protein